MLNRMVKRRLALALHELKRRTMKKDYKRKFLKRMLMHCAERGLKECFEKWKNFANCEHIAEQVNVSILILWFKR